MGISKKLLVLLLGALALRLVLIPVAHHGDLNNNISWGNKATEVGLVNYYEGKNWEYSAPNQPPLYILIFGLTSLINKSIQSLILSLNNSISFFPSTLVWFWENRGVDLTAKLPGILADLGIGLVIYKYFSERKKQKLGLLLTGIWFFNPVTIYSSSIWGQTDSVVNLLGLLSIIYLFKKNLVVSILYLVLSILFKPSLVIFLPVFLVIILKQKYSLDIWVKAIAYSALVSILITVWFHPQLDLPIWLFNLYTQKFFPGEIGDLTANAFNFWWLVDPGKTLDSTLYLGIQARTWGLIVTLVGIGVVVFKLKEKISEKRVFFALSLSAFISFLFMTRIHERYLYPLFPSLTILLGFIPTLVIPYILISLLHLLNLYHLFWAPEIPVLENLYLSPLFMQILAVGHLCIFGFLMYRFVKLGK